MKESIASWLRIRVPWLYEFVCWNLPWLRGTHARLLTDPTAALPSWSARRINSLNRKLRKVERYLEIGVQRGITFQAVQVPYRVAVEPHPLFDLKTLPERVSVFVKNSDDYFESISSREQFDIVFLDGLHQWFQTYKDIINALNHLAPGGVILIDDVIPCDEVSAVPSLEESYRIRELTGSSERRWHGDVYKALFAMHEYHHSSTQFRVIFDPDGNSQALLWRHDPRYADHLEIEAKPHEYRELTFSVAFPEGRPPSFFRAGSEDEVLQEVIETLGNESRSDE